MKIRTQFTITLITFSLVLIIVGSSTALTTQQVAKNRTQENLANRIVHASSDLTYLTNDYVFYQGSQQLSQWQATYASFSDDVGNLSVDTPEQKALVQNIQTNRDQIKIVFDDMVASLEASKNQTSDEILNVLQFSWSRMSIKSQTLIDDTSKLAELLRTQVDQLNMINIILIIAMIGTFSTFLTVIYIQTFRRTLKSLSTLREGTAFIGSGDLDFKLKAEKEDEIGELSNAFNKMTANLKTVTSSKAELENEINERKKAEESLRKSERRWSTTLSSIGDSVIATDVSGAVTFMNGIAEKSTGWSIADALGKPLSEVFHIINEETREAVESPIVKVLEKGMIVGLANHTILLRKDGGEVPLDDSGAPIKDENGNITGVVLVFHDISERKEMEQKLEDYRLNLEKLVEDVLNNLRILNG